MGRNNTALSESFLRPDFFYMIAFETQQKFFINNNCLIKRFTVFVNFDCHKLLGKQMTAKLKEFKKFLSEQKWF